MTLHSPLVERTFYHFARARAWARRATMAGLAVRVAVWLTGTGALVLAAPPSFRLAALPFAVVVAVAAAAMPGSGWVSAVGVIAIGGTAVVAADDSLSLWRVLLLAAVLYAHHTAAALGAQLRTDAVIPPSVLRRWAGRAGVVVASSLLVGLGIAALADQAPAGPATGYVALGTAAAVAVTAFLAWSTRR